MSRDSGQSPDNHEVISVRGAHVNNLKGVDVDIPKRRLTVFTGVSGSGKSSLVFGTVAAESQRLINETYSSFVQTFMPTLARPEVDSLHGITAAIIVDQERMTANARSTVGTVTDAGALLRILYSRLSVPHVGSSNAFSFNVPSVSGKGAFTVAGKGGKPQTATFEITGGMCPVCEGRGQVSAIDVDAVVDRSKSLNEGAILAPNFTVNTWYWKFYGESDRLDPDKPLKDYSEEEWHWFWEQEPVKMKFAGMNTTYMGLLPKVRQVFVDKAAEAKQAHIRAFAERIATFTDCPECGGTRLNEAARTARVHDKTLPEVCAMQVSDLLTWVEGLDDPGVAPLVANLRAMLQGLVDIGLGYLSIDRPSGSLSGGEAQRVKMVRHLGSALTDITYVFDEPTVGLHPHDIARMNVLLRQLRDKGNTVLVVEHKPEVIATADHIIDMGPGAGAGGGEIVYAGDLGGLKASGTVTGDYLDHRMELRETVREATGALEIRGANLHNLKDVDVDIPTGVLTVVTGVAGSGKSSLVHGSLARRDGVLVVDQSAIKGSRRSNPATYSGLLEPIRKAFAKENGVSAALFSANSEGACPVCNGAGQIFTELGFMETVATTCEECEGKRFRPEVLEFRLHGKNIDEVLGMSMSEAAETFRTGPAAKILGRLLDVGLPYLTLGQPLTTLSGGERQRLKLAASMSDGASTYILDEPTSGLHLADTEQLCRMLHGLVDSGHTVIVIEHNLAVVAQADHIIDIGPGAGHDGGTVVFEGTPAQMVAEADTLTAHHLREWLDLAPLP
ncbi:ATP-binding cassette domain-containing protein [Nostocoides sp. F2B08]|uniref:ATP-binding cassette domain-containing protein n=1 Tax=Nostocoides sp. F2B08 TaxID=2653936 RepID=UPI001263B4BF|nr:excinuclease ABC subunit UvrA [Tetrasphaera sp. F2B08]KAB7745645.1 ATP-binding cassette domain-containing protein [Tetrasphaera sp. F2B08]